MQDDSHELTAYRRGNQSWIQRFAVACRGVKIAIRAEASLFVHLFATVAVGLAGAVLALSRLEWGLVVLCVMTALCAELMNTAIERLAQAITDKTNPNIRDALDIASGAVLVVAVGAMLLGLLVFLPKLWAIV